jgi:hypothetical protein
VAGIDGADILSRQVLLLLDRSFSVTLLQRDAAYVEAAREAAETLVRAAKQMNKFPACFKTGSHGRLG